MNNVNRLALGTAQFGVNYGIANNSGQVKYPQVADILQYARAEGINTLDTAIAYGESEQYLGEVGISDWNIITKLPELLGGDIDMLLWSDRQVKRSLERLNVTKIKGLLLHKPEQLISSKGEVLWKILESFKKEGLVEKIGFSIYSPNELDLLYSQYQPDLVQVSYNIFDRRIKASGWLEKMANDNVEIHVRSVFLQGLLLMSNIERPDKFNRWSHLCESWDNWLQQRGVTALEACLAFVMKEPLIDKVIVGVDTKSQLEEILGVLDNNISSFPDQFEINDLDLINPSRWNTL